MERELTEHAHRIALAEMAGWAKPLAGLRVSLNITAADLGDPGFADRLAAMVPAAGVAPDRLPPEPTHHAMLCDPARQAIGRTTCRELQCHHVWYPVVASSFKNN